MGALNAVTCDVKAGYRRRAIAISAPQVAGAVGVLLGSAVYGQGWLTVLVVTGTALVSGVLSGFGPLASASGLLFLLNTVVGAGLPMPGAWWLPPVLMLLGAATALALALLSWPLRPWAAERTAVADAYRAVAGLLAACGSSAPGHYEQARQSVTAALNGAYETLLSGSGDGGRGELLCLSAQLVALDPLVEAAPAADADAASVPAEVVQHVRALAEAVASGKGTPAATAPHATEPTNASLQRAVAHATRVVTEVRSETPPDLAARLGSYPRPAAPDPLARLRRSWSYGVRLAVCIGAAQAVIACLPVPRSYWVPLTVTFVLKPDFGSVYSRAVLRVLGTIPGLAVASVVLSCIPRGWWDVPVVFALAGLVPALSPRGYAHQTAAITPLILLLSDMLSHLGPAAVLPRILDSAIGSTVVLIAGFALWPETWRPRTGRRIADTLDDLADYLRDAGAAALPPGDLSQLRRRLYRDLSAVRTELQRATAEPPPIRARVVAWLALLSAVERVVDATTAARVRIAAHPAQPPSHTGVLADRLRRLAQALRQPASLPWSSAGLGGAGDAPLSTELLRGVRAEIAALETAHERLGSRSRPRHPARR
ncbi:FUSC family protein [Streptomyces olivaceus]